MNYRTEFIVCLLLLLVVVGGGALAHKSPSQEFKHEVVIIDGCEYLKFRTYQNDAITHKGNCKNHEQ